MSYNCIEYFGLKGSREFMKMVRSAQRILTKLLSGVVIFLFMQCFKWRYKTYINFERINKFTAFSCTTCSCRSSKVSKKKTSQKEWPLRNKVTTWILLQVFKYCIYKMAGQESQYG